MKLIEFAVKRPVSISIIVLVSLILGWVSVSRLSVDLYPDMDLPVAVVVTEYPGAGPEEVESQVSEIMEQVLGTLSNVKEIRSRSEYGSSLVAVLFTWQTDMDNVVPDIREKIGMIEKWLPAEAEKPMVLKADPNMMPIIQLGIHGDMSLSQLQNIAEDEIENRLERIEGVASVILTGGYEREVQVIVDPVKLEQNGIALNQVAQLLAIENFNESGGKVQLGDKEYYVRSLQKFESIDNIKEVRIFSADGRAVRLEDIAEIKDTHKDLTQMTRIDEQASIGIHIIKQSDANTVSVSEDVKKEMEELKQELPGNIEMEVVFDQADYINDSLGTVKRAILEGALLAMLILLLFLRHGKSTLIIFTAIPISIVATFILMYFSGMTLNLISLGGIALGVGRMVDNSIVVLENIFRHRQEGENAYDAAVNGTWEVARAVTGATIVTAAVFLPIIYLEGLSSILFKPLALTVTYAIFASLLVSLTIMPLLASRMLTGSSLPTFDSESKVDVSQLKGIQKIGHKFGMVLDKVNTWYRGVLGTAIHHRARIVVGVIVLFAASLALLPVIGAEFLPKMDAGQIAISIEMDRGTLLNTTDKVTTQVEEIARSYPEISTIFTSVGPPSNMLAMGDGQPDKADIMLDLTDKKDRQRSTSEICESLRKDIQMIPGARIKVKETDPVEAQMGGSDTASPIVMEVKGDNLDTVRELTLQLEDIIKNTEGTREVTNSFTGGKSEIQVHVDRQKIAQYGLYPAQVSSTIRMAVDGCVVSRYKVEGDNVDIRVRYAEESREKMKDLEAITIATPRGNRVPISEIATLEISEGPMKILRHDDERLGRVTAQITGRDLGSVNRDVKAKTASIHLPSGYYIESGGQNEDMLEAFSSLALALLLAIILVYAVMAIQYESLFDPLVIMFAVPTCIIGVIAALVITGKAFSVPSFIGGIMLVGIAVGNAIVLVDYVKQLREGGMERDIALVEAGAIRLRPILMTSLTTILGLVPLSLGFAEGSEAQQPMAIVVIGGLLASTVITLVLVPVVYSLFDDIGRKFKLRKDEDNTVDSGELTV